MLCCKGEAVVRHSNATTRVLGLCSIPSPHKKIICDGCSLNLVKNFYLFFCEFFVHCEICKLFELKWSNIQKVCYLTFKCVLSY